MNKLTILVLKSLRKIIYLSGLVRVKEYKTADNAFCNQEGNDLIFEMLSNHGGGFCLSKWGTIELSQAITSYKVRHGYTFKDIINMIKGELPIISINGNYGLYNNAGVFPNTAVMADRFGQQALIDCQQIDILGSYIFNESYLYSLMSNVTKVNLDAFYAPWLFNNPWTKWLKGKKVLVVHPFAESISSQYHNRRDFLFDNSDVLPEFESLTCIKAVQTQAGETSKFTDWFEALDYMKEQIDSCDYEVAIIGCGAYGMSLAAHVKRQGKIALHLAGWTQMLFGVYGERWVKHQPQYARVINKYWIRPNDNETPKNAKSVEGACYW